MARLVEWHEQSCKNASCPVADCAKPEFGAIPRCIKGLCEAERVPYEKCNDQCVF